MDLLLQQLAALFLLWPWSDWCFSSGYRRTVLHVYRQTRVPPGQAWVTVGAVQVNNALSNMAIDRGS